MGKDSSSAVLDAPPSLGISSALPERQTLSAMEAHEQDKARRRKEFEKARPVLAKCVDPDQASRFERQKARYNFDVQMSVMERDPKTKKFREQKFEATVEAMNEDDAWAVACDTLRKWPNRRTTDHKIVNRGNAA